MSFWFSLVICSPVSTSTSAGTTLVMFAASCSCDTPVSATAEIESICPGSASSFCAVL